MDTPIGQFVLIGNFRRRLARELLVLVTSSDALVPSSGLVTTSKALVTTSVALVPSSVLASNHER